MKIFLDANICLDFLDSSRLDSKNSINWYMKNKDNQDLEFYFSGDFITTFYYILTQKKKLKANIVINAINQLCEEIIPVYLVHSDFLLAQKTFSENIFDDFEDLMILHSASRIDSDIFVTNDKKILELKIFNRLKITDTINPPNINP
jgi:predicted nucleic acid-binding protein